MGHVIDDSQARSFETKISDRSKSIKALSPGGMAAHAPVKFNVFTPSLC